MASATVRLRNYRETMRALDKVNKGAAKAMKAELVKAAVPVITTVRQKLTRYRGTSLNTIGPRASVKGVFVTQRARKVTGQRPDFGRLQQAALEESLAEHEDETVREVERALDRLADSAGF